jgi:cytosine/adenosine deaminase-related metal-dependent hydrolase
MTLLRNYAADLAFWPWLLERVKPLEDHLVPEDVRVGARLGIAEMIRGGTTCFHDMYFHLDEVADEVASAGLRARLCGALFDNSGQGEALLAHAVGVHGIYVDAADQRLLREGGVAVAHNPGSNLSLANGIAPVHDLLAHGINLSLGTDGAASNNNLNLFEEMHLAALLQKWLCRDAEALPARQALRMATINGAKALGLDAQIGSLEVGKQADVVVIDAAQPHLAPRHDPIALLVYSAQAADVCTVLVNGRILLEERAFRTLDGEALLGQATEQTRRLLACAAAS